MAFNPNQPNDLASTLRRNASGQTVQVSPLDKKPKDLKQLVDEAGLPVAPLTPVGAAGIGANPDQQKMMGTPAQKKAVLEQPQDLSTALRTSQARTQATTQEQGAMQTALQAQALSGLSSRVQGLVSGEITKATSNNIKATDLASGTAEKAIPKVPGGKESDAKALLSKVIANPNDKQSMKDLNLLLGRNIDTVLTPEEVTSMYGSVTDAIAQGVGGSVDKDITVSDLLQRGNIGYTPEQMADLLNLPQDQIANLSIAQLRERIDQVGQEEFDAAGEASQNLDSTLASQAERESAREAFKDQNAVGLTASKADYDKVEQAIQSADRVKFGGKDFSVEELLKDGGISKTITEYLNSPAGSQARSELEKSEPALVKFINDNKAVLDGAVKAVGAGTQEFKDIQTANKSLGDVAKKLNPSLTKGFKFGAGSSQLSTDKATSSGSPVIDALRGVPADRLDTTVALLNQATEQFPGIIEGLNNLSPDQISKWDISNPNGAFQSRFLPTARFVQSLSSTKDPTQIAQLVSPGSGSWDEIQSKYREMKAASQLGIGKPPPNSWDTNRDGNLDSPEMIRDNILASLGSAFDLNKDPTSYKPADNVMIPKVQGNGKLNEGLVGKLVKAGVVGGNNIDVERLNFNDIDDTELNNLKVMGAQWSSGNREKIQSEIDRRKRAKDEESRKLNEQDRKAWEDKAKQGYTGSLNIQTSGIPGGSDAKVSNSGRPSAVGSVNLGFED